MPSEADTLSILDETEAVLSDLGYRQYEISNYARGDGQCLHNRHVWLGGDFVGVGPGASSRVGALRWTNSRSLDAWNQADREQLSITVDRTERLIFAFRLNEGVDMTAFSERWECPAELVDAWLVELSELLREGVVIETQGRWRLSGRGRRLADSVAARLMDCL
jgi:oxygen-independent coproporphyrinogen-3 oxidase